VQLGYFPHGGPDAAWPAQPIFGAIVEKNLEHAALERSNFLPCSVLLLELSKQSPEGMVDVRHDLLPVAGAFPPATTALAPQASV
jgi:hypothetical protein